MRPSLAIITGLSGAGRTAAAKVLEDLGYFVVDNMPPSLIERVVDLATLTGAIIVALGSTYAGLFSNDDGWFREVESACDTTGEIGWRLPLHPEFFDLTKGQYADLTNASEQRKASSIYAAEFLRQFVDDRPWVHMDIAGTAWGMSRPYVGSGASGFGVRSLVELSRRSASS